MTIINIVKRFLRLSAEDILNRYRSYFSIIDHGNNMSDTSRMIDVIESIYNVQTNKLLDSFVDIFNSHILELWDKVMIACKWSYNSEMTYRLMLNTDMNAYDICQSVDHLVQYDIAIYINNSNPLIVDAVKEFMTYYNNTGVPTLVKYHDDLHKLSELTMDIIYEDLLKKYDMKKYVSELDNIISKTLLGNSFEIDYSRTMIIRCGRYEYIVMLTDSDLVNLCKSFAKSCEIDLGNYLNDEIIKIIHGLIDIGYYNDHQQSFGYCFRNKFRLDGTIYNGNSNDCNSVYCYICLINYDSVSNNFTFKHIS